MKSFLVKYFKGNSATKRVLALVMVVALALTMTAFDVSTASAAKKAKINKTSLGLYVGATYQLKLTGTKIKSVKTSNKNIATVTKAGKVTAKKAGSATITLNGTNKKAYKCKVTVKNTTINKSAVSLYVGATYQLKLTGTTINGIKTTNSKVAVVNKKGLVTAKGAGTATITLVGKNKKNHKCKVTVKKTTINASAKTLFVNGTYQLKLTGTAIKSAKSSNTAVATVTSTGKVTAVKVGTATITLVGKNGVSHTCKVTVKNNEEEEVARKIELEDLDGLQADGTALVSDTLEVSYGSALGTPKSLTWYLDNKVVEVYTTDGGAITASQRVFKPSKTGVCYAVILNTRDEKWVSNEIKITNEELAAKMTDFTLTEDYSTAGTADPAGNVVLATTSDKMVGTVTLNKNYTGRFYLVDASKTEYKTSDVENENGELSFKLGEANDFDTPSSGVYLSKKYKTVSKDSEMTEAKTIANVTADYTSATTAHAFRRDNKDSSVTYRFKVSTLTRGTNYKLIFDQENIEEDDIKADSPGEGDTATTATPNITSAVLAPYVKAPAALAVSDCCLDGSDHITAKATAYNDSNMTSVAKWFATGRNFEGVDDEVGAANFTYYVNTNYNNTSGSAFSDHSGTRLFAGGKNTDYGHGGELGSNVCVYAKLTANAGIFSKEAFSLTSPFKAIATTQAATLSVGAGSNVADVKVTLAGQRSAGTLYLLKGGTWNTNAATTASAAVTAFDPTDSSTYIAKRELAKTAGECTFENIISGLTDDTNGDVYTAVFIPSDDTYLTAKPASGSEYNIGHVITSYRLTSAASGDITLTGASPVNIASAIVGIDQFGNEVSTGLTALASCSLDAGACTPSASAAAGEGTIAIAFNNAGQISLTANNAALNATTYREVTIAGGQKLRVTVKTSTANGTSKVNITLN